MQGNLQREPLKTGYERKEFIFWLDRIASELDSLGAVVIRDIDAIVRITTLLGLVTNVDAITFCASEFINIA